MSCRIALAGPNRTCPGLSGTCPVSGDHLITHTSSPHFPTRPAASNRSDTRLKAFRLLSGLPLSEIMPSSQYWRQTAFVTHGMFGGM